MTKDDVIRMADLVGYDVDDDDDVYAPASGRYGLDPRLEHFAQLVAEHTIKHQRPVKSYTNGEPQYAPSKYHCVEHPDAIHGFDRSASFAQDRYVCECESWANVSTKSQNVDTSKERVHEIEKSIHETWVGLTDEEIYYIWSTSPADWEDKFAFPRAIEAALRSKNDTTRFV